MKQLSHERGGEGVVVIGNKGLSETVMKHYFVTLEQFIDKSREKDLLPNQSSHALVTLDSAFENCNYFKKKTNQERYKQRKTTVPIAPSALVPRPLVLQVVKLPAATTAALQVLDWCARSAPNTVFRCCLSGAGRQPDL
jgi:hypothetical protein